MSSLPDAGPKKVPGWKQPWDTGRKLMMTGCATLLVLSLVQGITHFGLPRWVDVVVRVGGYVLLAIGFAFTMRLKRERRMAAAEKAKAEEAS